MGVDQGGGGSGRGRVLFVGTPDARGWYLSRALRDLGWQADVLDWNPDPSAEQRAYGRDFAFRYKDQELVNDQVRFYLHALDTYDIFHFAGARRMTFGRVVKEAVPRMFPGMDEIALLKARGKRIVHTVSGCFDGVAQSAFRCWDPAGRAPCDTCPWEAGQEPCNDETAQAWGEFRNSHADFIALTDGNRAQWNLDPRIHFVPEALCLDPELWRPGLTVPSRCRLAVKPGAVAVYHSPGPVGTPSRPDGATPKGTHIYVPLLRFFQATGLPLEWIYAQGVPAADVRYYQAQADLVVDELSYGAFGATGVEALMLGKPCVCFYRPSWLESLRRELPEYVDELPIIQATPDTVHDVVKGLISDPARRAEAGARSREFALKWHSAQAGARRWDRIYSDLLAIPPHSVDAGPAPAPAAPRSRLRTLYLETNELDPTLDRWKPLSYVVDWREAFLAEPRLDVELCNISDASAYAACLDRIHEYDLIIASHAATGDDMSGLLATRERFLKRRGKLAVFIGNEYDIMAEKIRFIQDAGADFICTQLPLKAAAWLYDACVQGRLLALPHGLNPNRYHPQPWVPRTVDIGFKGDIYYPWVGDMERTRLIRYFADRGRAFRLACDIQEKRVDGDVWCRFLNGCKGIMGAESGTYYLNERGGVLKRAKAHMKEHPETSFEELHERYFRDIAEPVSGKAISSRHFEPIGTKTCQIMLEGDYNGILRADEHYIPVQRDLSDVVEAIFKFKDEDFRRRMVDRTFEYVMDSHTYAHRVREFVSLVS